jgi:release factor glutamine methyltransferase
MTYRQICRSLEAAGIEDAKHDAALLIEHFCKIPFSAVPLDPDRDYASAALSEAVERRATRYPLQYILGEWCFYRQTYEVSPDCLIPRSDTEILVEEAIRLLPRNATFADLCTGSGCIAVSVLAERPDTTAVAVDLYPNTLAVAARNAAKNGVQDRFVPILDNVLAPTCTKKTPIFDAILSNPPYIRSAVLDELLPELSAEPTAALDGGEDGLIFYRSILSNFSDRLSPNGFFLFEIGFDQADEVLSLGRAHGFACGCVLRDLGGCDRVVFLSRGDGAAARGI